MTEGVTLTGVTEGVTLFGVTDGVTEGVTEGVWDTTGVVEGPGATEPGAVEDGGHMEAAWYERSVDV